MPPLTVRTAASRLGVGYSTLKHWIHDGHVRTTQTPGGHHRIDELLLVLDLAGGMHVHQVRVGDGLELGLSALPVALFDELLAQVDPG